jgi:RNA polymerase sigma-70 factor, ECF subfamily
VALSEIDKNLLDRCLLRKPKAWEDFVDRFMGLIVHVVNHTAKAKNIELAQADRDDLCSEVFLAVLKRDFAVLRNFSGRSSLATYLTVISRRIVVRELLAKMSDEQMMGGDSSQADDAADQNSPVEKQLGDREEVERLLSNLPGSEAQVVRMYHIEGRSYREISEAIGMPENSIGPILSRAREKMRRTDAL